MRLLPNPLNNKEMKEGERRKKKNYKERFRSTGDHGLP